MRINRASNLCGEVSEWPNEPDSKSGVRLRRTVGSNPTLSAKSFNASIRNLAVELQNSGLKTPDHGSRPARAGA